jgi:membrane associated rhomboid family serine protease
MSWADTLLVFASSYALVFLLVIQQRTIQASRYLMAFLFSSLIGVVNTLIVRGAVGDDLTWFLIAHCLGGSSGVVCAIWLYDTVLGHKDKSA